jgi:predicted nucleic acid-binding protein
MRFWDTSAILPLCLEEPHSPALRELVMADSSQAVWWGTPTECHSAFARLRREERITPAEEDNLREDLAMLGGAWTEIEPSAEVRTIAGRLLLNHPLRAADALQMAAALVWAGRSPTGERFVCLDQRLREVARKEGFVVVP